MQQMKSSSKIIRLTSGFILFYDVYFKPTFILNTTTKPAVVAI